MKLPIMSASPQGLCTALAPDMCLTFVGLAAVPLPYPNVARCGDGQGSSKVSVDGKEVMRVGDKIARSTGDEAGNAPGGIVSGSFTGKATAQQTPQTSVKAEGKVVMVQGGMTGQNSFSPPNTAGGHTKAGQGKAWIQETFLKGYRFVDGDPLWDAMEVMICSSTLYEQLREFRERGGQVKYGKESTFSIESPRWYESYTQDSRMTITINRNLWSSPKDIVRVLSFELGRVLNAHPNLLYEPGMSEPDFVRGNLDRKLRMEAYGHYNQCFLRDQIMENCGTDIGNYDGSDEALHDDFMDAYSGRGWEDWDTKWMGWKPGEAVPYEAKVQRMAELAGKRPCGDGTVREFYKKGLQASWRYYAQYFGKMPIPS